MTIERALGCLNQLRNELLAQRTPDGHWVGELSASALSTATAVSALSVVVVKSDSKDSAIVDLLHRGCRYLNTQQNVDGGYGDTDRSLSNIATSYLVLAARTLASKVIGDESAGSIGGEADSLRQYIQDHNGIDGLRKRYGKDKTFVVPILTNLAIAGLVDWSVVVGLPFEAAIFPGRFYRFLRMPVVSYAIPALVAIGQVHHFCGPKVIWPLRALRSAAVDRTTQVLANMQPQSGGYLEATPLTSFVLMSLAACASERPAQSEQSRVAQQIASQCIAFLRVSIRDDGSWPIDTDLATWVTSLAIHGLGRWSNDDARWTNESLVSWHLDCQYQVRHPFTGAAPGGWGWTAHSGAVPDGDDTPAAILAAIVYREAVTDPKNRGRLDAAIRTGLSWLADLQNSDGGLPTFCRGWGKLPFDRSSTDLTAHFIRAVDQAGQLKEKILGRKLELVLAKSRLRALRFLRRQQREDGSWLPLWFGNQDNPDDENPIYGTARVLMSITESEELAFEASRAVDFLLSQQNVDGGWGGGPSLQIYRRNSDQMGKNTEIEGNSGTSSIEETAVALEAIADYLRNQRTNARVRNAGRDASCSQAIIAAVECLVRAVDAGWHRYPWPIGFYFAKLWYYEKLYPLVFATAALSAAIDALKEPANTAKLPLPDTTFE
jgi:squalene-hopene/tetraprenyl-beta-curcumene cyclase